jgi:hypothetical protein
MAERLVPMRPGLEIMSGFILVAALFSGSQIAHCQVLAMPVRPALGEASSSNSICRMATDPAALEALRLVCQRKPIIRSSNAFSSDKTVVIGFVGGFVKADDLKHPEILFASYLREHYSTEVQARVFSNHEGTKAFAYVMRLLDRNHDGLLSNEERRSARIIIYGHSWGASETAAFAAELGGHGIPVLLTIQLDIIAKPGQNPTVIPPNVANAINFYQPDGVLHGRPKIVAFDPALTAILGNIRMTYDDSPVNCDNYNWFVRTFNKPHHEIENDARVWDRVAALIDAEVPGADRTEKRPTSLSASD